MNLKDICQRRNYLPIIVDELLPANDHDLHRRLHDHKNQLYTSNTLDDIAAKLDTDEEQKRPCKVLEPALLTIDKMKLGLDTSTAHKDRLSKRDEIKVKVSGPNAPTAPPAGLREETTSCPDKCTLCLFSSGMKFGVGRGT